MEKNDDCFSNYVGVWIICSIIGVLFWSATSQGAETQKVYLQAIGALASCIALALSITGGAWFIFVVIQVYFDDYIDKKIQKHEKECNKKR
jgi:hypothetical protein